MYNYTCNMHGHTDHFGASPLDSDYKLDQITSYPGRVRTLSTTAREVMCWR